MFSTSECLGNSLVLMAELGNFLQYVIEMSDFWQRVDEELDFIGKNRTYLANKCGFSLANIGKGIKLGSAPSADTAVKIANVLGVSVEYLVLGSNPSKDKSKAQETDEQLRLYKKYHELITSCEKLKPEKIQLLKQIADNFLI